MKFTGSSIDSDHCGPWIDAIGKLVINFGYLEYLSYEWADVLGKPFVVKKNMRPLGLAERIVVVRSGIEESTLSKGLKRQLKREWISAEKHLAFRNKIAHGPIILVWKGGEETRPPAFVASYSGRATLRSNPTPEKFATVKDILSRSDDVANTARRIEQQLDTARQELAS